MSCVLLASRFPFEPPSCSFPCFWLPALLNSSVWFSPSPSTRCPFWLAASGADHFLFLFSTASTASRFFPLLPVFKRIYHSSRLSCKHFPGCSGRRSRLIATFLAQFASPPPSPIYPLTPCFRKLPLFLHATKALFSQSRTRADDLQEVLAVTLNPPLRPMGDASGGKFPTCLRLDEVSSNGFLH